MKTEININYRRGFGAFVIRNVHTSDGVFVVKGSSIETNAWIKQNIKQPSYTITVAFLEGERRLRISIDNAKSGKRYLMRRVDAKMFSKIKEVYKTMPSHKDYLKILQRKTWVLSCEGHIIKTFRKLPQQFLKEIV